MPGEQFHQIFSVYAKLIFDEADSFIKHSNSTEFELVANNQLALLLTRNRKAAGFKKFYDFLTKTQNSCKPKKTPSLYNFLA